MTSADTNAMAALHELLEERQRYEGWIGALEGRRATTPAHVFDRVHTDYTLRLERVLQRLSERTGQLQATIEGLTGRLDALRGRETERADARQEAELRAVVGEFGDEEWERIRGEADREIEAIAGERRGVEAELAELRRIVELTRRAPEAEQGSGADEHAPSADSGAESDASDSAPSGGVGEAGAGEPNVQRGVAVGAVETSAPVASASARPSSALHIRPAAPGDTEAPSIDEFIADWPVRQLETPGAPTARSAPPAQAQGDGVARVPEVDGTRPAESRNFQPGPATTPPLTSAFPAEPRREQEKTLACPECGTLNYATEWYCERCGGELATF